jgi:hypothetical protein
VASARRLSELDGRTRFLTRVPSSAGWANLLDVARPEAVDAQLDELGGRRRGMRSVAAAQLAASIACTVVRPVMAMLFVERRVPEASPEMFFVEAPTGGRFERLAVLPGTVTALDTDAAADHPATRAVSDPEALLEAAAEVVDRALSPVLRAIRVEGRYGLAQSWGAVLDMIGATSLLTARLAGLDQRVVWGQAQRLCAMVRQRVEQPKASAPRPFFVEFSGGEALYTVKGTCCLRYREHGLRAGEALSVGAVEAAFCKTCPFLRDDTRRTRCSTQMEHEATRGR